MVEGKETVRVETRKGEIAMPNWLKTVFICLGCILVMDVLQGIVLYLVGKKRQEKQPEGAKK